MRETPEPTSAPTAAIAPFPSPLAALLRREGLVAASVTPITTRPSRSGPRATFRVSVSGGRLLKGRVLHREGATERMQRWLPLLPERRFTRLLATGPMASLETWYAGTPAPTGDHATVEAAGEMLGAVHALLPLEVVSDDDPRLRSWWERIDDAIDVLDTASRLIEPRRVRARLADLRVSSATHGLVHGDLCLENLVVGEQGLCCVDNTTVSPGVLEADLARSIVRWQMTPDEQAVFLDGYRRHADPAPYLEHADLWMLAVALRSAAWRNREGCDDIGIPLEELARHVD